MPAPGWRRPFARTRRCPSAAAAHARGDAQPGLRPVRAGSPTVPGPVAMENMEAAKGLPGLAGDSFSRSRGPWAASSAAGRRTEIRQNAAEFFSFASSGTDRLALKSGEPRYVFALGRSSGKSRCLLPLDTSPPCRCGGEGLLSLPAGPFVLFPGLCYDKAKEKSIGDLPGRSDRRARGRRLQEAAARRARPAHRPWKGLDRVPRAACARRLWPGRDGRIQERDGQA